jgi:hypothetical protein
MEGNKMKNVIKNNFARVSIKISNKGFDEKGGMVMKNISKKLVLGILSVFLIFSANCIVVDEDDGHGHDSVVIIDPGPVEYWYMFGDESNVLDVGEGCGICPCTDTGCCDYFDTDYSFDTIEMTVWDEYIVDLQFNFVLTNWGSETTTAWVSLCDDLGCEDVIEIDLLPGEVYWDRLPNPVLDSVLDEYFDCLFDFGDACWMFYDVEVYLGEDCTCTPVSLDYYYEGLYVE